MLTKIQKNWQILTETSSKSLEERIALLRTKPEAYPTSTEVKKAKLLLRKARTKAAEDKTNKAKKLQKIIGDHESIIDLIRLKMEEVGFPSIPEDFLAKASDIRFVVPKSKVDLFWVEFKEVLKKHLQLKATK
jgi:hypothetical protein